MRNSDNRLSLNNRIGYMICESATAFGQATILREETLPNGKRRVIAEARLQTADETNRNGRMYTEDELFREIDAPRQQELIGAGYMRAESGHPLSKDLVRQQTIDPSNTCAKFLKIWTSGKDVMCHYRGTNNALGECLNSDLLDGDKPAWSLRALGCIENTRLGAIVRNLKIITYDHVIYPSHPGAYTTGIVSEGAGIVDIHGNKISSEKDGTKSFLLPFTNESVIKYIQNESANFNILKECFDVIYTTMDLIDETHVGLTDSDGNQIVMYLEDYISNEIMRYCSE